jgi:hypothetical protein
MPCNRNRKVAYAKKNLINAQIFHVLPRKRERRLVRLNVILLKKYRRVRSVPQTFI